MQVKDPVIVTVYWPGVEELKVHAAPVTLPEIRLVFDGQETETVVGVDTARFTVPEKPKRLARLMVPLAGVPVGNETEAGPDMLKSVIVTLRMTEWLSDPLVPFVVTV